MFGAVAAASALLVTGAGGVTVKAPTVNVSVSEITAHSAKITAKINPEHSETAYVVWVDDGCNVPECERAGPYEAKTGRVSARKASTSVSVTVRGLPERTSNNEAWVDATNASGTTMSMTRVFRTK